MTKHRLSVVESTSSIQDIENKIGCGQVEELIVQAENELKLVKMMEEHKVWESLQEAAPAGQWQK